MKKQMLRALTDLKKVAFSRQKNSDLSVSWNDFWITLLAGALWYVAFHLRPWVIYRDCFPTANLCTKESLPLFDQLSVGFGNTTADAYSFVTQNLSGAMAIFLPLLWSVGHSFFSKTSLISLGRVLLTDLLLVFQVTFLNGFLTEFFHLISHRARPFVYLDPALLGETHGHYTSFYSGHTSFAAAANVMTLLLLLSRGAPLILLFLTAGVGQTLIFSTAYFRVLAGRHFLSDVLAGAFAGTLVAMFVYFTHIKPKDQTDSPERDEKRFTQSFPN